MLINLTDLKNQSSLPQEKFEKIIGETLKISPEELFLSSPTIELSQQEIKKIKLIEEQILSGTPPEYIFKKARFCNIDFFVDKNVLIPRPETEILVEEAVNFLKKNQSAKVLDLATGSGCIAICLKKQFAKIEMTASDLSGSALEVARKNCHKNHVKIRMVESNLLEKINDKFDLICTNLPYIASDDQDLENLSDPKIALDGGKEGFELIEKVLNNLKKYLKPEGLAIFEIGYNHRKLIRKAAKENNLQIRILKDLAGYDRFARVTINKGN
jgi:release factor glutamine methyltransferase